MPYVDFANGEAFDEMEELSRNLFGKEWDCCDCDLWEQGRYDGTCIHYINSDCPCGYHEEVCEPT